MAYTQDNRLKYFIRYNLDITQKGTLNRDDFEFIAFRAAVLETRGNFKQDTFNYNAKVMDDFWTDLEKFAEFKRGKSVSVDEFRAALKKFCTGKAHKDLPKGLKVFITVAFNILDLNGDGLVGIDEYRLNAATKRGFQDIKEIDDAYNKMVSDVDKKAGGINLTRFEELFAQYLGSSEDGVKGGYLLGPLRAM